MKHLLYISIFAFLSAFSTASALAQDDVAGSVTGAPETETSSPRPVRPPVKYSTPDAETMKSPPAPLGIPQQDFENLYYQKEMWREYLKDYEMNHRPQPRDSRRTGSTD